MPDIRGRKLSSAWAGNPGVLSVAIWRSQLNDHPVFCRSASFIRGLTKDMIRRPTSGLSGTQSSNQATSMFVAKFHFSSKKHISKK